MIPLYKSVKIVLGVIFGLLTLGALFIDGRWLVGIVLGVASFGMFYSAYHHGE
jgi:hypothetical protein